MTAVALVPPSRRFRLMGRSLLNFATHDIAAAIGAIAVAIGVWEIVTLVASINYIPPPTNVASRLVNLFQDSGFRSAFFGSIGDTLIALAIAIVLGGLTGVVIALSKIARLAFRYYVDALLIVPPVALAPILIVIFGITSRNIIAISTLYGFAIIAVNSSAAVRSVDQSWVEVGQVYGAGGLRLITSCVLPGIMPQFFSGLHLGVTRAFKGMIVGQVFLGVIGVGGYEARFQQAFDVAGIWAIAVLLIASSLILTWAVKALDHLVNYWAYRD